MAVIVSKRIVVPNVSPLPDGYTLLEYIDGTGTQYINTNVAVDKTTIKGFKMVCTSAITDTNVYRWRVTGTGNIAVVFYYGLGGDGGNTFYYGAGNKDVNTGVLGDNSVHTWIIDAENGTFDISGTSVSVQGIDFTTGYSNVSLLYLFAYSDSNSGGTKPDIHSERLYSCTISYFGDVVRNFVPCKDSSGTVGLYDTISKTFFGNAGTGTFVAGPEL